MPHSHIGAKEKTLSVSQSMGLSRTPGDYRPKVLFPA
jgi:hypothetical protein